MTDYADVLASPPDDWKPLGYYADVPHVALEWWGRYPETGMPIWEREIVPVSPSTPGPLRWKFDGGRGAMLNRRDEIVGYWRPPSTREIEASALEDAAAVIIKDHPEAAALLTERAARLRRGVSE